MSNKSKTAGGSSANRSAFREEFYSERDARKKHSNRQKRNERSSSGKRRRVTSVWLPVFGLGFLLCILAVAGSSAMIWLRKLGAIFGVHWTGDL